MSAVRARDSTRATFAMRRVAPRERSARAASHRARMSSEA
jgi:hypothetical protein